MMWYLVVIYILTPCDNFASKPYGNLKSCQVASQTVNFERQPDAIKWVFEHHLEKVL